MIGVMHTAPHSSAVRRLPPGRVEANFVAARYSTCESRKSGNVPSDQVLPNRGQLVRPIQGLSVFAGERCSYPIAVETLPKPWRDAMEDAIEHTWA